MVILYDQSDYVILSGEIQVCLSVS